MTGHGEVSPLPLRPYHFILAMWTAGRDIAEIQAVTGMTESRIRAAVGHAGRRRPLWYKLMQAGAGGKASKGARLAQQQHEARPLLTDDEAADLYDDRTYCQPGNGYCLQAERDMGSRHMPIFALGHMTGRSSLLREAA